VSTIDAQGDERFREHLSVHRLNLRSVLCLPMRAQSGVLGALYLDNRQRVDAFSDTDIALLTAFGDQAAIALANARMIDDLAERTRDLEHSRAAIEELNARLAKELEARAAELELVRARTSDGGDGGRFGMVGTSAPMREVYRVVERVADKDVAVAILGESGTGKELVARAVHSQSSRQGGPFVSVNCGAIPRELLESELFGHERGAFTGAVRTKPGLFEVAAAGTLFLDEIGDMPLEMQVKLLRVLQQKELRRVGGTVDIPTNVRVVSASNRDVPTLVRAGGFREDLWYRLNVVEIRVPPLRARRDDLPLLIDHFLRRFGGVEPPRVRREALALLLDYEWPGNVRELENELQRALALAEGPISERDLGPKVRAAAAPMKSTRARKGSLKDAVERYERDLLTRALDEHQGRVASVARALGLTRAGLYKKLHKYGFAVAKS
jgi:serine/threonine-protein kinase PknK